MYCGVCVCFDTVFYRIHRERLLFSSGVWVSCSRWFCGSGLERPRMFACAVLLCPAARIVSVDVSVGALEWPAWGNVEDVNAEKVWTRVSRGFGLAQQVWGTALRLCSACVACGRRGELRQVARCRASFLVPGLIAGFRGPVLQLGCERASRCQIVAGASNLLVCGACSHRAFCRKNLQWEAHSREALHDSVGRDTQRGCEL